MCNYNNENGKSEDGFESENSDLSMENEYKNFYEEHPEIKEIIQDFEEEAVYCDEFYTDEVNAAEPVINEKDSCFEDVEINVLKKEILSMKHDIRILKLAVKAFKDLYDENFGEFIRYRAIIESLFEHGK